jgi:hypothetical protein
MPKLIPFPATIVKRKPVAMLRWPTTISEKPNVHATPTPMVITIVKSVRRRRKKRNTTPTMSSDPKIPTSVRSLLIDVYSLMPVWRSPAKA